jgi:flagellin-like protein
MDFTRRRAVSPIIASLLLIAIAVAAGVIVYIYVNGLAGNLTQGGGGQVTERLQLQSYSFAVNPTNCVCSQWILDLNLINSGGGATTISAVYFDGSPIALATPYTSPATALASNAYATPSSTYVVDTTAACTSGQAADAVCFSAVTTQTTYSAQQTGELFITFGAAQTAGTTHTVKVVSVTGGTDIFSVTAGRTG